MLASVIIFANYDYFLGTITEAPGTFVFNTTSILPADIGLIQARMIDPISNIALKIDLDANNLLTDNLMPIQLGNPHDDQGVYTISAVLLNELQFVELCRSHDGLAVKYLNPRQRRVLLRYARVC
jgi:hypothetical protein